MKRSEKNTQEKRKRVGGIFYVRKKEGTHTSLLPEYTVRLVLTLRETMQQKGKGIPSSSPSKGTRGEKETGGREGL